MQLVMFLFQTPSPESVSSEDGGNVKQASPMSSPPVLRLQVAGNTPTLRPSPEGSEGSPDSQDSYHSCESESPIPPGLRTDRSPGVIMGDLGDYREGQYFDSSNSGSPLLSDSSPDAISINTASLVESPCYTPFAVPMATTETDRTIPISVISGTESDAFLPTDYNQSDLSLQLSDASAGRRRLDKVRAGRSCQYEDKRTDISQSLQQRLAELRLSSNVTRCKRRSERLREPVDSLFTSDDSENDTRFSHTERYVMRSGVDSRFSQPHAYSPHGDNQNVPNSHKNSGNPRGHYHPTSLSDVSTISGLSSVLVGNGPRTSSRNATAEFSLDLTMSTIHSKDETIVGQNDPLTDKQDYSDASMYWSKSSNSSKVKADRSRSLSSYSNQSQNSTLVIIPVPDEIRRLSDTALHHELELLGEWPGPVTASTRKLYETRLTHIRVNPQIIQQNKDRQKAGKG